MKRAFRSGLVIASIAIMVLISAAQSPEYRTVTDQMLRNPSPEDWLNWRRTMNAWGYSPLTQINRANVNELRMVWGWAMGNGTQETTPLVHDGVMFLASPGNVLDALDAATGDLLWEYRRDLPDGPQGEAVRNLAIYQNKVYMATADAHIVALDALTGQVAWDVPIADPKEGFNFGAGPLIVNGKVISGLEGCAKFVTDKCSITALDALTGKELWRTRTVSTDPSDRSWGTVEPLFRAGTDMWESGSYDPELNLIYWPVDQAKPWTRAARGTDGAALYSDSTLALDPNTGKIVWYRQYVPGETHDMDDSFENILVDVGSRKSVFEMGKLGILFETDRETGKPVRATDLGYQTLVDVDVRTGTVSYRDGVIPQLGKEMEMCPSVAGVKSWRSMAYHPETHAFYIPVELTCQKIVFADVQHVEGGGGSGLAMRENTPYPPSDGKLGQFIAMDISGKILWKHSQRAPFNSAALTTGGGLVFVGDWNRYINAYDVRNGDLVWQTRTTTSPQGFPITYSVRGRQYIAVPIGVGSASWGTAIPIALTPEIRRPNTGNAIVVYALPDAMVPRLRDSAKAPVSSQPPTDSVAAIKSALSKEPAVQSRTSQEYSPLASIGEYASGGQSRSRGSGRTIWDGIYSEQQATHGEQLFKEKCSTCHERGDGGESAPALTRGLLLMEWSGHSLAELFTRIRGTMPEGNPGSLTADDYADITAYLLKANNVPSGRQELKPEGSGLAAIKILSSK
jgi:alcohol dehydrogenase (cytochrome c)